MYLVKRNRVGKFLCCCRLQIAVAMVFVACSVCFSGVAIAAPGSFHLGTEALQKQRYGTAIDYFDQAIQHSDRLDEAYGSRCLAYLMIDDSQQAVRDCSAALDVNPQYPKGYFYRGLAWYRLGEYASASADLTHHLQVNPQDARAYYNHGLILFAQGDIEGAIDSYHHALTYSAKLYPIEMSNLYNDLGVAYLSGAQLDVALVVLDAAVSLDSSDPRAYFNRGCICHQEGDYLAALSDFNQTLLLDPSYGQAYINRSLSKQQLGDVKGAIADLASAIEILQQQQDFDVTFQAKLRLQRLREGQNAVG